MRPRREDRYIGSGTTVTIDLTVGVALTEAKAESKADVRALLWRKIEALDPLMRGTERLTLDMLKWICLTRQGDARVTESDTEVAGSLDRLSRAAALHEAAERIERQIDDFQDVAVVFDHNEALSTNELWPE